jgi:type II secretory ATPase GspE/PulE/Tfp pilus assembly ATPase PilB-like protein
LENNQQLEPLILEKASSSMIRKEAIAKGGMVTMAEDGESKVASGITTEQEVARILGSTRGSGE